MSAPVAIVGMGCRLPGGVEDPATFWRLLVDGVDAITEIPRDRLDVERLFDPRPATPGRLMSRWGGFLDGLEGLDAGFFSLSPREAERLDPQQRLLLETAWEALEDAGQDARALEGSRTAVYVGQWLSDFEGRLYADPEGVDFYMTTGSGRYASSGRLSYVLGLRGPSVTLDTACSSSLTAVHLAVRSLRSGECALALAGGVNVILQPHITIAYSQSLMMAPDGRCKFGDASGDGYVRSEGAGVVVLKPLARAVADGDRVYAVIRGSAVNNDGRSSGSMGTPSRVGQEELLRHAYRDAGIAPGRVRYVEAHGTGTRAGDPVELGALATVLAEGRRAGARAYVGSVKTNLGHTEGAAGVAGLIKAALALHHGAVPPSLHHREPTPAVPWAEVPFSVPSAAVPWPDGDGPRVAGVSAFGIAGTNAHVVLEEAPASASAAVAPRRAVAILPLSARSPRALRVTAERVAARLSAADAPDLHDVCWSAATRRTAHAHRAAFVAADRDAMATALRAYAAGDAAVAEGVAASGPRPRIAFVVPGQGGQWPGMALELLAREPAFRAALEACDRAARRHVPWSIVDELHAGTRLDEIDVIQPALVAVAIAYAAWWRSIGVEPDAVVGHSLGEVAAAHLAGVLDLDAAMRLICRRSALMRRARGRGAMALVELSWDEARARVAGREDVLAVAVSNSPRSAVLSGDPAAVAQVVAELVRDGIFARLVKVDVASHSPQMDPLAAELASDLADLTAGAARVPLFSTVLAERVDGPELDAGYWARNLRQPVRFAETVTRLVESGIDVFVELGPHPVLLPSIQQTAQARGRQVVTVACGRRDAPGQAQALAAFASLWTAGVAVDWRALCPEGGRFVALPLTPWQRERHWVAAAELCPPTRDREAARELPDEESRGWLHRLAWVPIEPPPPRASGGWLVAGHDAEARALAAALPDAVAGSPGELASRGAGGLVVLAGDGPDAGYLPVRVLQAVLAVPGRAPPRIWFVTRGAQPVTPGRVSVDQAALWGAARVVAEEHPELWGGLCDLDPDVALADQVAPLARHLLAGDGEDQVALRGGARFVLRLATGAPAASAPFAWRSDATYLITGGLGGAGLHVARSLARAGARRLILLGRTALPPRAAWAATPTDDEAGRRVAAVRALEAAGVAVHVASLDVGDEDALRAYLERHAAEGWPPIRGVIHAAATLDNHLAARMDREAFDRVVRTKLRGAQHLDRLLPELDLFVLFSSVLAFLGQPGQANYAAANAGLDALAHDRRARGQHALSVGWGVWADTGLARGPAGERALAQEGFQAFTPERATRLFGWLCGGPETAVAVLPMDWSAYRRARRERGLPLYRDLLVAGVPAESDPRGPLDAASPAERRRAIEAVVHDSVARVLGIAPARLDPRRSLGELGLSSLLAMELRNRLEAALGRSLSATLAWNHPTVVALATHLAGDEPAAPPPVAPVPVDLGDVADLTDDEAARALATRPPRGRR